MKKRNTDPIHKALHYTLYCLCRGALKMLSAMPRPAAYRATRALAQVFYALSPWHRRIVQTNLNLAMPGLTRSQAKDIAVSTFANIERVAIELAKAPQLKDATPQRIADFVAVPEAVVTTIRSLLARGKGLLYLTGHIGVWELLPSIHTVLFPDIPLSIVVRPLDNPYLDRLINQYRSCLGIALFPKKNSIKDILAALKRQETIGILLDQNVCREEGVFVDFLGKEACTNFGLAALALRTNTPVLPIGLFYDHQAGVHRVHSEPEVPLVRTGNKAQDIRLNTAHFTSALGAMVQKYPDQWLWVHRRWKTRPEGSTEKIYS